MGSTFLAASIALLLSQGADVTDADVWKRQVLHDEDAGIAAAPLAASIHTADAEQTGVLLQCSSAKMSAYFAVEPLDFEKLAESNTSRARSRKGRLFIDGELVDEQNWIYLPSLKAAWPTGKGVASKVFNAIVQGKTVEFEVSNKDRVTVYLPTPDDEFRAFADDCKTIREARG